MTKLGAKLLTATIKNPQKRNFIYNMLMDYSFANTAMKQNASIEWLINCVHNYLSKPKLVVVWLVGGLGNQMYFYVFGKALESMGYSVIFDANAGGYAKNYGGGGIQKINQKRPQISAI